MKWLVLLLSLISIQASAGEVRVAVAANFLSTLKALQPLFETQTGYTLSISSGSTGKLYAQIINGAPFDVLLSADRVYTRKLEEANKAIVGSRFVYATGRLVLWSRDGRLDIDQQTLVGYTGRVAIANPKTAPYGLAAKQVIAKLGITEQLKLIQGESVGQAFQFAATGNVGYGFVALSQVMSPFNTYNRDYYWLVPSSYYSSLEQEAALLKKGQDNPAATAFLRFMQSPKAREVIAANGYR